ncbi:hypothetical protein [Desulfoferrobacter suflitae]|uniref:hypothetical protein n=1 Tax=Desulfoferrobacter suflitae TaxID=2865782 RepID=UPI0021644A5D|nr:hypothetical protein [Desulfoferrobacter suflitae]MCK8602489.1 hypothetical protein [Desulfoferrobacter suflitae]
MPYGIEQSRVDSVLLDGKIKIAVYPEIMKELGLQPDQTIDEETAKKIVAENEKYYLAKN